MISDDDETLSQSIQNQRVNLVVVTSWWWWWRC
jgi:hypothetical protein